MSVYNNFSEMPKHAELFWKMPVNASVVALTLLTNAGIFPTLLCFYKVLNFDFLTAKLEKSKSYLFLTAHRSNQIFMLWFSRLHLVEVKLLSALHLR